jgi:hypothetical protein
MKTNEVTHAPACRIHLNQGAPKVKSRIIAGCAHFVSGGLSRIFQNDKDIYLCSVNCNHPFTGGHIGPQLTASGFIGQHDGFFCRLGGFCGSLGGYSCNFVSFNQERDLDSGNQRQEASKPRESFGIIRDSIFWRLRWDYLGGALIGAVYLFVVYRFMR